MVLDKIKYDQLAEELKQKDASLIAVSKTKPVEDILRLYEYGQRDFGENYVQELTEKQPVLPADVRWHFIGHLQRNKVKYIAPFVYLIHGVDSLKLLKEIDKEAAKCERVISVLLQVHIAMETSKFGFDETELEEGLRQSSALKNVAVKGLMGMASFTDDQRRIAAEFGSLKRLYDQYRKPYDFSVLSMGMSSDYRIAIEEGSNMVRIGSLLFGARQYS